MTHELQAVSIIITALIVAMLLLMISLPVSYYDVIHYQPQPASMTPEPGGENGQGNTSTSQIQTTVTIVYKTP